jgi:peroxiredoxin
MNLGFDVVEFEASDHVAAGDEAPEFTRPLVTDEFWEDISISELTDEAPAVLVFHPMDGDFPATYIWQEIRDRGWVDDWDAHVVGLSISTPYEHKAFLREWREFEDFRLFSDPANEVAERYGVVHDLDGMSGISEPKPAVFVVDEERVVRWAWVAETWPEFPPYSEIEDAVAEL